MTKKDQVTLLIILRALIAKINHGEHTYKSDLLAKQIGKSINQIRKNQPDLFVESAKYADEVWETVKKTADNKDFVIILSASMPVIHDLLENSCKYYGKTVFENAMRSIEINHRGPDYDHVKVNSDSIWLAKEIGKVMGFKIDSRLKIIRKKLEFNKIIEGG